MRHVIIGGAGFIGCNLAARLHDRGEQVIVVDNFSRASALDNVEWLKAEHPPDEVVSADIRSDRTLLAELAESADAVYHLAAQVAVTTSVRDPRLDFEVNALGTLNVLEALRTTGSEAVLVYSSTNKVYGAMEDVSIVEDPLRYRYGGGRVGVEEEFPIDLHSPYGCSKGAGDQYVRDYARIYGLNTVVLRQSCIYGPRQFGIEDQGWLAWFCIGAVFGRKLTIYGNGKQVRDLLHVGDLINLMLKIVDEGPAMRGEIFNVGGGPANSLSLLEAIDVIEQKLGTPIEQSFAEPRPGDQLVFISDISKLERVLGWSPQIAVTDGIGELSAWIQQNRHLFAGSETVAVDA
jgi:CDP-paratose 2-epimerase